MKRPSTLGAFVALSITTVRLAQAAVYQSLDELPAEASFDFVIVGGAWTAGAFLSSVDAGHFLQQVEELEAPLLAACRRTQSSMCCSLKLALSECRGSSLPVYWVSHITTTCSNEGREDLAIPSQNLAVQAKEEYIWNWWTVPQVGVNNRSIEYKSGHVLGGGTSISESTKLSGVSSLELYTHTHAHTSRDRDR